jgi:hypothetical protein
MKTLKDFINEKKAAYDFSCAMLYLDFPQMSDLHGQIDRDDVYVDPDDKTFGLETEPHVTLLYGLHNNVGLDKVEPIVGAPVYSKVKAYNPSLFENDKYDVLKFDVKGDNLHKANEALRELPYKNDYPDYHPHCTVGYLKKGTGSKYCKRMDGHEHELMPTYAVFSQPDGTKTKMNINTK